jgi:murein DD-endopeptidase MepM/ murein hydrolase activator NlpD
MVLLATVQGAFISQKFGLPHPGVASLEPAMWAEVNRAAWQPYTGSIFRPHFHPGIDRAAPAGTPVRAMEAGTVRSSGWLNEIDGIRVEVEIRPGTRYAVNHLQKTSVRTGQAVSKGQQLGTVGCTGSCTGPHTHEGVSILEPDPVGIVRTFLYNPELFMEGGVLQNDSRIQPLEQYLRVQGPGINIRFTPPDPANSGNIFATSRQKGIYRRATGNRIGPLTYRFRFLHWTHTDDGTFAVVRGFHRRLAIRKSMVVFL